MKIMVIVNNAADARHLVEQVPEIKTLNVANFGRITDNLAAKKRIRSSRLYAGAAAIGRSASAEVPAIIDPAPA